MRARALWRHAWLPAAVALLTGCERHGHDPLPQGAAQAPSPSPAPARVSTPPASSVGPEPTPAAATRPPALTATEFSRLFSELSEADAHFFSTNYVSNETSYLQVADSLARRAQSGGAYLGVGPEQNYTYIALSRPALAFLLDIRRQNALLHLLYKAIFDSARTRGEFLALLLGRPYSDADAPASTAALPAVFRHVLRAPPDRAHFLSQHERLVERIVHDYQVPLSSADRDGVLSTHEAFFQGQLETKFELPESGRKYPTLGEILAATDPTGTAGGFLATDAAFRFVQRLHRQNRIVPVVGDFAGEHALQSVARELEKRRLTVSVFYVSNVEQYVMEPRKWLRWLRNVKALPSDSNSLFLRCYLDQGKRHPEQLPGHRTATVLQRMQAFEQQQEKRRSTSYWQVATNKILKN